VQAAAPQDEPPLEILAEIHRVIGKALCREDDPVGVRASYTGSATSAPRATSKQRPPRCPAAPRPHHGDRAKPLLRYARLLRAKHAPI
jgi:hypothetical protein